MVKTSMFDYEKPSPKAIDSWRSAYTNAVILEPVRIMITYVRQTENGNTEGCSADVNPLV